MLEQALNYAARGWRVFPCKPRGKTPLIKGGGGFKSATVAPSQITEWWTRYPTANIGIATGRVSGLLVIDIDGKKGLESLIQACEKYNGGRPLENTLLVVTARGWHLYYSLPFGETGRIPCSSNPAEGIDFRADGGYVLAPPSVHPSGFVYYWSDRLGNDGWAPPIPGASTGRDE